MRKKVIAMLVGAVALVAMAGPASAATSKQRFNITAKFTNDNTTSCRVVATGPISGTGTCTVAFPSETVTVVHLMLPNGTVEVRFTEVKSTDSFKEAACLAKFSFQETFTIIGGTGAYAGATGSGTDTGKGIFTAARTPQGGCDPNAGSGFVTVTAKGT